MTAEIGKIIGQSLGVVMKVDQNRTGDCLGDYLCIKVELNVFQPLCRILKVRLPNGVRVDVDLLYEGLYAYCFLCRCFDHVDLGCQRYTCGVIDAAMALYGSWLQAEAKCVGCRNLRGRRFSLGEEDYFVDSDEEQPSENGPSPSPGVMSDPGLGVMDLETSPDCRNDAPILFHEPRDLAQEHESLIEENPQVDLAPLIPI